MGSNKDFEAYATSLFGEDYSDKKGGKAAAPWAEKTNFHPKPFDIIVVDKNDNVLTEDDNDKEYRTGIGKSLKPYKPSADKGRLTPIIIDMNESPFDDDKAGDSIRKKRKPEKQRFEKPNFETDLYNKTDEKTPVGYKKKSKHERVRFEADDSGISLNEEGDEGFAGETNVFREHLNDRHEDSGSESDLAYFCVDHMQMCRSRNEVRKHRKCNLDHIHSRTNSPVVYTSNERVKNRTAEGRLSSLSGDSRSYSRGRSPAAFLGMQTMYRETLEKLYNYSGVIIEDRQGLKKELHDKKSIVEEKMMEYMEELITCILKLKNRFLVELDRRHNTNLVDITHQTARISKMRHEVQSAWQNLQVPSDFDNFDEYRNIIMKAAGRSMILQEILRDMYESCTHYEYAFQLATEVTGLYKVENVVCLDKLNGTPLLPPFLSVKSSEITDDDSVTDFTSLKCIEGFENVGGKHESGNESCCFTGCAYILDDSVLLADWSNGSVKMLNKQGLVADTLVFEQSPWDIVRNSSGQVAVTVPKQQTVFFVEAEPHLRIVEHFKTGCDCFGICKIHDNYAITCDPWSKAPSVRVFDKFGNTMLKVQTDAIGEHYFKCPLHVCTDFFSSVIYVSDATADCVYALSMSGDIIFCYRHNNLEYPTGVETDRNNCLYVCGKASSNIHKLANDGSLQEVLLKQNSDVKHPCALAFHPNGDHMILTDLAGEKASGHWKLHFL